MNSFETRQSAIAVPVLAGPGCRLLQPRQLRRLPADPSSRPTRNGNAGWSDSRSTLSNDGCPSLLAEARHVAGDFVGVDGDHVVFVPNATYGINAVARSLKLEPGDEVLTTDHEYGAVNNTWRYLCERSGATLHQPDDPAALRKSGSGGRPALGRRHRSAPR